MTDQINVGLVGFGISSRVFHAPVIATVPGLRVTKVVERHTNDAERLYPGVEVVRDADAMFEDPGVDLVVVTTPTASHFDLARRALEAGKHVVVEKPFTTTSAEADALVALARDRGRVLTVYQNRRWDGDFLTIRRILGAGLLGRLVEFESHFDRYRAAPKPGAWRETDGPGSGILYDLGSHLVDQALVLLGRPLAIAADARTQRDGGTTVDSFELFLHYDGLKVLLKAGMLVREEPKTRFVLHGTHGSFVKYGLDPQEDELKAGRAPAGPGWGEEPEERWGALDTEVAGLHVRARVETLPGAYQDFYRNVLDAIRGRAEIAVRPEEARDTIRVIELAAEASAAMRAVPFS